MSCCITTSPNPNEIATRKGTSKITDIIDGRINTNRPVRGEVRG